VEPEPVTTTSLPSEEGWKDKAARAWNTSKNWTTEKSSDAYDWTADKTKRSWSWTKKKVKEVGVVAEKQSPFVENRTVFTRWFDQAEAYCSK
jgi:hypothetical protein